MDVIFRTKKLEKCYKSYELGCRAWGLEVAKKFIQRVDLLQEAVDLAVVRNLPGLDCHQLKGPREGQFAITLHARWRRIFTLAGEEAEIICVEEVSKHCGG